MKKLLSILLVAITSVCLLSCSNKATSAKPFAFGKDASSPYESILTYLGDYDNSLRKWDEENKLQPAKWYKVNYEAGNYLNGETYTTSATITGSGWYYVSPYENEKKYSLEITCKTKITNVEKDGTKNTENYTLKVKEVFIDGITYSKLTFTGKQDDDKAKEVDYSNESYAKTLMSSDGFSINSVFYLLNKGTLKGYFSSEKDNLPTYVSGRKLTRYSYEKEDDYTRISQYIIQLDQNSPFIKGLKIFNQYIHYTTQENLLANAENKTYYDEASYTKLSVDPSFFGFVSRPKDYHKYL